MSSTWTSLSTEASTQNISPKRNNRGKNDPAWGHCKQLEDNGKIVLLCLYCDKIIRGGDINRLKSHLAGEKRQVQQCKRCQ